MGSRPAVTRYSGLGSGNMQAEAIETRREARWRAGVIGASRTRNGTGEFVARFLSRAGAEVVAVAGSSRLSAVRTAGYLAARHGFRPCAAESVERLVADFDLDLVAICSPKECHASHLDLALEGKLDVFCEKPLMTMRSRTDVEAAAKFVRAFAARGLVLHHNTQWRYTIPDFMEMFGLSELPPPANITVRLSPTGPGVDGCEETLPHANSLVLALGCNGAVEDVRARWAYRDAAVAVEFQSGVLGNRAAARIRYVFISERSQPRMAAYALNGMRVRRVVDMSGGYSATLADGARRRPIGDPLERSVRVFLTRVAGRDTDADPAVLQNLRMSQELLNHL
jgi:NAD(P)-dependent dehydrogenase (short-subunit alcohol dehydrogenase family)